MKKFSLLAAVLLYAATAKSNTYTVTNANDAGLGSLRAAIDSANNRPGQDSIVFTLSFPIINLASPLQTITDSLIIQGMTCQAPTISGASFTNTVALFNTSDISIPLTLNYLFISNAYNQSFGAQGGGVDAGPVFINYCAFVACTAEDNSGLGFGSEGGAIVAQDLVANNSTFINNNAFSDGEGPASLGGAVAVYTNGNFYNCTFVGNTVDDFGSAIYINNGNINNCTLDSNAVTGEEGSGAIFGDDPNVVVIANSIVWGSTAASGFYPGIYFFSPVSSGGCNILEQQADNSDFTYSGSDITGSDPLLFGSVHMYGGCVPTLPIHCGSPAIHHATCTGFTTTDARGVPALTARDAGAYQTNSPTASTGPNVNQCGGTAVFNAANALAGELYQWSDGNTYQRDTVSTSGTYTVTITNTPAYTIGGQTGCSVVSSFSAYLEPAPIVNLGPAVFQCGGSVTLDAGNAGDNYKWSNNDNTQFITINTSNNYRVTVTDPGDGCSATASVSVFIDNPPVVNLGTDITQCGGTVLLDAGNSGDDYTWSDGSDNETLLVTASGYFTVTVEDEPGCTGTGGINVTINPVPTVYLPADTAACGSEVVLDAGGAGLGYSYGWFDESGNEWDTITSSGQYSVTVFNGYNCSASAQTNVTLNPAPVVNLGGGIVQCGGTVTLDAVNQGDQYFWSDDSTNETITVSTSGQYSVTVTNGFNCSASGSTNVYIEPTPYVNLGHDTSQCGGTVTLNAWNAGDLYNWSDGETTQVITVSTSNSYNVTVTDPNSGCTATSGLNVQINTLPVINLGPDITQCGGSVTLDAGNPGSQFIWSQGSTNETITVTTSGQYSVTVTNDINCPASDSINVYINLVPTVYLGQDITRCGGSVTLDAGNPGFIYSWSTNATTQTIQVSVSDEYGVTVTSPVDGCTASDSINVTIDTLPVVNLGPDTTNCGGPVILYAGNAGATYLWSDNSMADSLSVMASGIYRVTVTNSNGCSAIGSVTVTINPIPAVTLLLPANVCNYVPPFALTGGLPVGGTYFEADTAISIFNANQQGIGSHQFKYVYSNIYGCIDSDSASIYVRPQPIVTTLNPPVLCVGSPAINLNNYFTPPGGVYTGNGVSQNLFYPKLAVPGIDTIVDIYTDNYGCMDTEGYFIPVNPDVHTDLTSSVADFTICLGQSITLTATGADFYQFFVNGVGQADSVPADSTFTTTTLTDHSIIYAVGSNACSTDTSEPVVIDVITPPVVSAGPDTTITLGQSVELHGAGTGDGNLTYLWTPGNGLNYINVPNPTFSGSDTTIFWFKAEDSYGCADSAQVTVNVYVPNNILLPTVITPNGDGYNDLWILNPKINLNGSHLVIFDRWGEVVFETENYANNWGGTYKNTGKLLPDDTYYFVLKAPAMNNYTYEGPINIISGKQ